MTPQPSSSKANSDITVLLHQWRNGDAAAENELFDLVNGDLRRLAHFLVKGERNRNSMQATELVDQVYIRLVAAKDRDWQNRQHFFAIAARAMRRHLIDLARGRPDAELVALEKMQAFIPAASVKLEFAITVDRLLNGLSTYRPELCNLVELKYFLGLTDQEAADVMGVKLRTMQRMWLDARQWLFEHVNSADGTSNPG